MLGRKRRNIFCLVGECLILALVGCATKTIPDPNDPEVVPVDARAQVLRQNLQLASDAAFTRAAKHEISQEQAQELVTRFAQEESKYVDPAKVSNDDAWIYGELMLTARDWQAAETILIKAVAAGYSEDRFVNDSLRLAEVEVHLGNLDKAIALIRGTYKVRNFAKAPILPAVLLRIVPAATGKGRDVQLAAVLEEAIHQHEQTIVDASSVPGKAFLIARPHHIHNAWKKIVELEEQAGRQDLAQQAIAREQQDESHLSA